MNLTHRVRERLPYRGMTHWVATWAVLFIGAQLLWHCARTVRRWDMLELPLTLFFPPGDAARSARRHDAQPVPVSLCADVLAVLVRVVGRCRAGGARIPNP